MIKDWLEELGLFYVFRLKFDILFYCVNTFANICNISRAANVIC